MPLYHFNIKDGISSDDVTGTHFPDVYRAQAEAVRFAGEVIAGLGAKFWNGPLHWVLEVTDETKTVIFVLTFTGEERDPPQLAG